MKENNTYPALPPKGYIKVLWKATHPEYSYSRGDIGIVHVDKAQMLLDDDCIDILPDDYQVPAEPQKRIIPDSEKIEVIWLKPNAYWAYNEGNVSKVTSDQFKFLVELGNVRPLEAKGNVKKLYDKLNKVNSR